MRIERVVELGAGRTLTVRELTVAELRAWLAQAEAAAAEPPDVLGEGLLAGWTLRDLAVFCALDPARLEGYTPSELARVAAAAQEINADFFALGERLRALPGLIPPPPDSASNGSPAP